MKSTVSRAAKAVVILTSLCSSAASAQVAGSGEAYSVRLLIGGNQVYEAGDTAALKFGEYHRIRKVDPKQGAVTLFITGRYRGTWGFLVNGEKVPYKTYLGSK